MITTPALDERQHAAAFIAAIEALGVTVFEIGQVPDELPTRYATVAVERRPADARRSGRVGRSGWRLMTEHVGRTPDEARWVALRVSRAVDGQTFPIDGAVTTPVLFESGDRPELDEKKRYVGTADFTYAC